MSKEIREFLRAIAAGKYPAGDYYLRDRAKILLKEDRRVVQRNGP